MPPEPPLQPPHWPHLLQLIDLAADWVWEQDASFRFTRLAGNCLEADSPAASGALIGKKRWDTGLQLLESPGGWPRLKAIMQAGEQFRDLVMARPLADGSHRYLSISGAPYFATDGRLSGYRGIGRDVTAMHKTDEELHWFQEVIDASHDSVVITDVETQRFLYANRTALETLGYSREEFLQLHPHELTGQTAEDLARAYADVIAAGAMGMTTEPRIMTDRTGKRKAWWELHRRAVKVDGRWLINTISTDVTRRILAERAAQRSARMYATLSASNESIMHARNVSELFQQICNAAVEAGGFISASILLVEEGARHAGIVAKAGIERDERRDVLIPVDADHPQGNGLIGTAYRSSEPCISNDFTGDPRTTAWHELAARFHIKAAAAIPILRGSGTIGVLLLLTTEKRAFDDETLDLLQRITQNITLGLQKIDHEQERERVEERIRYLATHDSLTGLPNRLLFSELLASEIHASQRNRRRFALLFLDLDHFKEINDTLGHAAGDELLKTITHRLRQALRSSDIIARMSGDEFVLLLRELTRCEEAATAARKLLDATAEPMTIGGQACQVSASIGISCYPIDGEDERALMKRADTAMYQAKYQGKNGFCFFTSP